MSASSFHIQILLARDSKAYDKTGISIISGRYMLKNIPLRITASSAYAAFMSISVCKVLSNEIVDLVDRKRLNIIKYLKNFAFFFGFSFVCLQYIVFLIFRIIRIFCSNIVAEFRMYRKVSREKF